MTVADNPDAAHYSQPLETMTHPWLVSEVRLLHHQLDTEHRRRSEELDRHDRLVRAVARLHLRRRGGRLCTSCHQAWPCTTRRLLTGEEENTP